MITLVRSRPNVALVLAMSGTTVLVVKVIKVALDVCPW